jgi:hypothetical protein
MRGDVTKTNLLSKWEKAVSFGVEELRNTVSQAAISKIDLNSVTMVSLSVNSLNDSLVFDICPFTLFANVSGPRFNNISYYLQNYYKQVFNLQFRPPFSLLT